MLAPVSKDSTNLYSLVQPQWCGQNKERKSEVFGLILQQRYPFNIIINNIKIEYNRDLLQYLQKDMATLPAITIPPFELDVSEFHPLPIEIQEEDSHELKEKIYSFNRKISQMVCDHSNLRKLQLEYLRDLHDLFLSEVYKKVKQDLEEKVNCLVYLEECDKEGKKYHRNIPISDYSRPRYFTLQRDIMAFLSKYTQTHCPKCEKNENEYNAMVYEVEQRRLDEQREYEKGIKRIQGEAILDMNEFMETYFPNRNRVQLGEIVKMWKQVYKGKSTTKQDDVGAKLEETGKWHITNSKNIKYANKIEEG